MAALFEVGYRIHADRQAGIVPARCPETGAGRRLLLPVRPFYGSPWVMP
jgi:hypothetical protein